MQFDKIHNSHDESPKNQLNDLKRVVKHRHNQLQS